MGVEHEGRAVIGESL